MATGSYYNGYSWKERDAKFQALKERIAQGKTPPPIGPCDSCGDSTVPVEYHDENYSQPYVWEFPALLKLCGNCHMDKLHKRFFRPRFSWEAFLAHVRRGGYASELKDPKVRKDVIRYRAALERGEEPAALERIRPYDKTPGEEWFANLSLDPVSLTLPAARTRP